ncbi:MAG: hypothetical protein JEZ11_24600 [Desulfobacterales bacterium]|nr:hypothetical protein [Desulfobacterales bacterium]
MTEKTSEAIISEVSRFAEWRGTVKETLKHLAEAVDRFQREIYDLWDNLSTLRASLNECRERCNTVCIQKSEKTDVNEFKKEMKADFKELGKEVQKQGKLQIHQQATLAFYGIIGGALFSVLMMIGGWISKSFKGN